jgi:hypothetical protein
VIGVQKGEYVGKVLTYTQNGRDQKMEQKKGAATLMQCMQTHIPACMGTMLHGYEKPIPIPIPVHTHDWILTVLPVPLLHLNDRLFYFTCHCINSYPNYMILCLFKSQDNLVLHRLFSDYYLFYLIYGRPIFSKWPNIETVF